MAEEPQEREPSTGWLALQPRRGRPLPDEIRLRLRVESGVVERLLKDLQGEPAPDPPRLPALLVPLSSRMFMVQRGDDGWTVRLEERAGLQQAEQRESFVKIAIESQGDHCVVTAAPGTAPVPPSLPHRWLYWMLFAAVVVLFWATRPMLGLAAWIGLIGACLVLLGGALALLPAYLRRLDRRADWTFIANALNARLGEHVIGEVEAPFRELPAGKSEQRS